MNSAPSGTYPLLRTSAIKAIMILLVISLGGLFVVSAIGLVLLSPMTTRLMRVLSVLQDVIVFVLPPAIMAVMVSSKPGRLLEIDRTPPAGWVLMAILALLVSTPAMNFIIELNENLSFPSWLENMEQGMRAAEESARKSAMILMGGTSVADLVMGILIIGVLAGISEEIYFRGAILGCLLHSRMNKHAAIWVTAVIFSLFHFQVFGFFPRVILGGFFGYLTWWTGSIWVAAIVHVINNSIVVTVEWMSRCGYLDYDINAAGTSSIALVLGSIILTAGIIRASLKRLERHNNTGREA